MSERIGDTLSPLQRFLQKQEELMKDPEYRARVERERAEREERERQYAEEKLRERRLKALSGVPMRAKIERALLNGEELQPTKALAAAQKWWSTEDIAPWIALAGVSGSGKSSAAAWCCAQTASEDWRGTVRWISAWDLEVMFTQKFGPALQEQDRVREARLLVIDDLGAETDPAHMTRVLIDLLERRQHSAARYRTVVTTNLNGAAFKARYSDARLASRMAREAGIVFWYAAIDADLRRKAS